MGEKIELNDEVRLAGRQPGRFVVVAVEGSMATIQPFAVNKNTGRHVYFRKTEQAALDSLVLLAKSHKRPEDYDEA